MKIVPDMVGLTVADIPKSIAFYEMLGLDFPETAAGEPYVECKTNGYRISLNALSMVKENDPHWEQPKGHRMELAFLCETPAHVDETHARIVAAGHKSVKAPWDAFWGQRYAIVEDPDGSHVSIFCPLK